MQDQLQVRFDDTNMRAHLKERIRALNYSHTLLAETCNMIVRTLRRYLASNNINAKNIKALHAWAKRSIKVVAKEQELYLTKRKRTPSIMLSYLVEAIEHAPPKQ